MIALKQKELLLFIFLLLLLGGGNEEEVPFYFYFFQMANQYFWCHYWIICFPVNLTIFLFIIAFVSALSIIFIGFANVSNGPMLFKILQVLWIQSLFIHF